MKIMHMSFVIIYYLYVLMTFRLYVFIGILLVFFLITIMATLIDRYMGGLFLEKM